MEAGVDRVWGEKQPQSLMLNYRYSTVGLLTDLGLDFGGEVIKYQDLTAKYSIETTSAGRFDIYGIVGLSSNDKDTISPVEAYVDAQQVGYSKDNIVLGVAHTAALSDSISLATTLNYSRSDEFRSSDDFSTELQDFSVYELDEQMVSLSSRWQRTSARHTVGVQLQSTYINSSLASSISNKAIAGLGVFASLENNAESERLESMLTARYATNIGRKGNVSVTAGALHHSRTGVDPIGSVTYAYMASQTATLTATYARAVQEVYPELQQQYTFTGLEEQPWQADNIRLTYQHKALSISAFYAHYRAMLGTTDGTVFSPFDELGTRPYVRAFPEFRPSEFHTFSPLSASVYGVDIAHRLAVAGIEIHPTLTLMRGRQTLGGISVPLPYDFGHIANIRLAKKWQLSERRYMGVGVSMHHRGGAYQSAVDTDRSLDIGYTVYDGSSPYSQQLNSYYRVDLRWYYIIKKGRYKSTLSLDIQNVTNRQNDAFLYYEPATGSSALQRQLGLLPVLSWRVSI